MEFGLGGTESMLLDIMHEQYLSGHKLWLFIFHDHISDNLIRQARQYAEVRFLHSRKYSLVYDVFRINYMISRIKPDIIHIHNPAFVRILFYPREKIVATIHGINQNHSSFFLKLGKIKKIFAISDAVKNDLEERYQYKNIVTVTNGIHLDKIAQRNAFDDTDSSYRIVQVSRLEHKKKGQDILIQAIAKIVHDSNTPPRIHVDFIGEGDSEEYLKDLTLKLECGEYVSFLGNMDRDKVYQALKDYDIIAQPSRCEGFGLTIIEGMAAGLIPLVSDSGGPRDIVGTDEKIGFLFQTDNADDCARVLLRILNLPSRTKNTIQQQTILKSHSYSIRNMVSQYESYYRTT